MATYVPKKNNCPCGNPHPYLAEDGIDCCVECHNCGRHGPITPTVVTALLGWNGKVQRRAEWLRVKQPAHLDPFPAPLPADCWKIKQRALEIVRLAEHLPDRQLGLKLDRMGRRMITGIHKATEAVTTHERN